MLFNLACASIIMGGIAGTVIAVVCLIEKISGGNNGS